MKFYFKKSFLSSANYNVLDRFGQVVFTIEQKEISLFPKFHIYDTEHNEIGLIETAIDSNRLTFPVYINGRYIDYIYQDSEFLKPRLSVKELCWITDWSLTSGFRVHLDGKTLATIHKHKQILSETYEIDIKYERDTIMVLAVMIALKCTYLKSRH